LMCHIFVPRLVTRFLGTGESGENTAYYIKKN